MPFFGNLLGQGLGYLAGGLVGHSDAGASIGGTLGNLLPFKKGGKIKKTGPIFAHKGEVVLPANTVKDLAKIFTHSPSTLVNAKTGRAVKPRKARKAKAKK